MFYYDWTMLLVLPGLLLGLWAQHKVSSAFKNYERVHSANGLTADKAARLLLNKHHCSAVEIHQTAGSLTDHYDPSTNQLKLSASVYGSSSVAAIGVAAHECGHAMQMNEGYAPLKLRSLMVPVVNIGSHLYFPIFLMGILFSWEPLVTVGILCFSLTFLFALVTLPVEFNASSRAIAALRQEGWMSETELKGAKAVLDAAALTYVASAVSSLLQLLRLVLISRRNSRD